jgi:hypothetical protein
MFEIQIHSACAMMGRFKMLPEALNNNTTKQNKFEKMGESVWISASGKLIPSHGN